MGVKEGKGGGIQRVGEGALCRPVWASSRAYRCLCGRPGPGGGACGGGAGPCRYWTAAASTPRHPPIGGSGLEREGGR